MDFAGVYCCLTQNPRNLGDLDASIKKVFGGTKDFASVSLEVSCLSGFKRTAGGGVVGDETTLREEGLVAHYHSGKDSRWLVPEGLVNLDALWITRSSFACMTSLARTTLGWN